LTEISIQKQRNIMAKKFTWKIWLQANLLTKDVENDYVADSGTAPRPRRGERGGLLNNEQ
jgi:hypothetical protein